MTLSLTRRQALGTAAALPLAAAVPTLARADGHAAAAPPTLSRSFTVGDLSVTTLLAGTRGAEADMQGTFGMNVSAEEFAAVSSENFIPTDKAQFFFTPTIVKSGENTILFDTGLNPAGITAALAHAGHTPDDITHVVITHMHGDHIGGLADDVGTPTFANAAYITGQAEFDHWAGAENGNFEAKVRPLAEKMTFIGDGQDVAPGVSAMAAFGHTPGHMAYRLDGGGDAQMMLVADLANHYVWSLGYPDWEVRFDMDKEAAAASRRKVLGMIAAEKMPMIGYHMPFPAAGYVAPRGDGFQWVPVSYQI